MDYFVKDVLSKLYEIHIINPTDRPFRPEYGRLVAVLTNSLGLEHEAQMQDDVQKATNCIGDLTQRE